MMLEDYFSYRGVLKRLRSGALGAEMDRIAEYFSSRGYKRASAKLYLSTQTQPPPRVSPTWDSAAISTPVLNAASR
jgi:hypothetical protein